MQSKSSECYSQTNEQITGFQVTGTVHHKILTKDTKNLIFNFTVKVSGCKWVFRVMPDSKDTQEAMSYDEVVTAGDGLNTYLVTDFRTKIRHDQQLGQNSGINASEVVISTNLVPNAKAFNGLLWLAFGSECFFSKHSTEEDMVVPICENVLSGNPVTGLAREKYSQNSGWILAAASPRTPTSYWSRDDGSEKHLERGRFLTRKTIRYPVPFDQGFTNIFFHVMDYTQVGDFKIPKKAELVVFWILNEGKPTGPIRPIHNLIMEVHEAKILSEPLAVSPQLAGIALVGDRRISISDAPIQIGYAATNHLPSLKEVTNMPHFGAAIKHEAALLANRSRFADGQTQAGKHTRLWLSLVTINVFAAVLLIWHLNRKQNQTKKKL